jgi:hypothetical protein
MRYLSYLVYEFAYARFALNGNAIRGKRPSNSI